MLSTINFISTGLQVYKIYYTPVSKYSIACNDNQSCILLGTSISLSPLGMVTVCPEGQLLLICERMSGSVLHWDVSVPHLAGTTQRIIIVPSQGVVPSPDFKIGFTEFNVTRTSSSPLTSQLLISNVTTEMNESTIYCSENRDDKNAPMTAVNIEYQGMITKNDSKRLHNYNN